MEPAHSHGHAHSTLVCVHRPVPLPSFSLYHPLTSPLRSRRPEEVYLTREIRAVRSLQYPVAVFGGGGVGSVMSVLKFSLQLGN